MSRLRRQQDQFFGSHSRLTFLNEFSWTRFQVLLYLISNWHHFVFVEWIHFSPGPNSNICRKTNSWSLFQKEDFETWGCSFVSDLKLRSTSSAEKNVADEITWIIDYLKYKAKSGNMAVLELTFRNVRLGKWSKNWSCYRRYVDH